MKKRNHNTIVGTCAFIRNHKKDTFIKFALYQFVHRSYVKFHDIVFSFPSSVQFYFLSLHPVNGKRIELNDVLKSTLKGMNSSASSSTSPHECYFQTAQSVGWFCFAASDESQILLNGKFTQNRHSSRWTRVTCWLFSCALHANAVPLLFSSLY